MMSLLSRWCRRLRHTSAWQWRCTRGTILFLAVLYILQVSASFSGVVNSHVGDQVSILAETMAEGGGGREDRTFDAIGAEPAEEDITGASGVSTFYKHLVELRIFASSKLLFPQSLPRKSLLGTSPSMFDGTATPRKAPPPQQPLEAPISTPLASLAPAPTATTPPPSVQPPARPPTPAAPVPTPSSHPVTGTLPPSPAPTPPPTFAPVPGQGPPPQRSPGLAPASRPAPSPMNGKSEPTSSSASRGLNSKTAAGISLVVVGAVLFALFGAMIRFKSKRVRRKDTMM